MRTFNFLPEYQKKTLRQERIFLISHTLIGSLLIVVALASTVLTVARIILIKEYNKIKQDTSLVNVEHLRLENNVDELNKKTGYAGKIQAGFAKWSELTLNLTNIIPPGAALDYLLINRASGAVRINGRAQDRAGLTAAKAALENSGLFKTLEAPLSNLLEKTNVEFRFTGILKPEAFTFLSGFPLSRE